MKNELYAGRAYWGRTRLINKKTVKQPIERQIVIEVPHLAIVDKVSFDTAQKRLTRNKVLAHRNRKREYLLSGFFRCGTCGSTVCGHAKLNRQGGWTRYYRCGSDWRKFRGEKCEHGSIEIVAYRVENAVWDWIKRLLSDPEELEAGLQEMIDTKATEIAPKQERLLRLDDLIAEEEKRIGRLVYELSKHDNEVVLDAIKSEIARVTTNRNALSQERERLSQGMAKVDISLDQLEQIKAFSSQIVAALANADYDQKRNLLDLLEVQVIRHIDGQKKWVEVSCGIPTYKETIELHHSAR